jgi:hypothetical protein
VLESIGSRTLGNIREVICAESAEKHREVLVGLGSEFGLEQDTVTTQIESSQLRLTWSSQNS